MNPKNKLNAPVRCEYREMPTQFIEHGACIYKNLPNENDCHSGLIEIKKKDIFFNLFAAHTDEHNAMVRV